MGEDDKLLFPERAVAAPPARKRTNTYDIHQPERMLIILLFPTRIMAVRAYLYRMIIGFHTHRLGIYQYIYIYIKHQIND